MKLKIKETETPQITEEIVDAQETPITETKDFAQEYLLDTMRFATKSILSSIEVLSEAIKRFTKCLDEDGN